MLRQTITALFLSLIYTAAHNAIAECQSDRVLLQVLGSGGPELNDQRASTSYLVWLDKKAVVMIDTGSGSSLNFEKSGAQFNDIKAIAFTHFHVDHSADFPEYIKFSYFSSRDETLPVYGPAGNDLTPSTSDFVNALFKGQGVYPYLHTYINKHRFSKYKISSHNASLLKTRSEYQVNDEIKLIATPVHHGALAAMAWRVETAGCSITFSGDMSNQNNTLALLAKETDVLVAHNAVPENANPLALNLHMPPSVIGKIAKRAMVKKLVLSHRMQRTLGGEHDTLENIRKHYQGTVVFADDLSEFSL